MNTDALCPILVEIEQLEREFSRANRLAINNLASWEQFVLDFCSHREVSYVAVMSNEGLVEYLNIRWLKRGTRFVG